MTCNYYIGDGSFGAGFWGRKATIVSYFGRRFWVVVWKLLRQLWWLLLFGGLVGLVALSCWDELVERSPRNDDGMNIKEINYDYLHSLPHLFIASWCLG